MIRFVGKNLIRRRLYTLLVRNNSMEDGYVELLTLPWNGLATVTPLDFEPEQLIWRDQIRNPESLIIESKADNVGDNTEERIVIQIAAHRGH
jgi:hypothetical protein